MVQAAPAAVALCLRFSTDLMKAAMAALIIGAVFCATEQHTDLTASVLQGFQCIPASDVSAADVLAFAQGLENKTAELSSAQLSCLAKLLAAKNLTADFSRYSPDLLLFFDSSEVRAGTCRAFYAQASRGNLSLLPRGSARRTGLLCGALACLGVRSSRLHPEQLGSLGALVCDMEPETITASDPSILENLKLCPALTGTQQDALNAVLLKGGTMYGDPSSWNLQTLQNLGPLLLALNQTTLSLVAEAVREAFGRSIVTTYDSQERSQREKSLTLLRAFAALSASAHPRLRRSAEGCQPITNSTVSDPFLIINYNSEQFNLCLSDEVLKANLKPLLEQPLPIEFLQVMKEKLDQIYPLGMPEAQLKLLGQLSRLYTAEEISQWMVTCSDTLLALLDPSDGNWEDVQIQQLLSRYLALGGILTGTLLQRIGGRNLCLLQEEQIEQIPPAAIRTAGYLNISSCSQTKKDLFYRKGQEAFAGQAGITRAYYCQIWPYLGGAPAKDLKEMAKSGIAINMDIDTFLALNPDELQKLGVMDVKNLLGENLPYLKEAENETSVMQWVKRQSQQELDCILGISLQGGTEEPSPIGMTTPPHPTTLASITPTATTPTPIAISSHPTTNSSTGLPRVSSTSTANLTPPKSPPPGTSTAATSAARPAPTNGSLAPCSTQQPAVSSRATPSTITLLTTLLASVNPNTTSPSSVPPPPLTHGAATTTSIVTNSSVASHNTSTPLVSVNPPAPGVTTHATPDTHNTITPSNHNALSTHVPNSTLAPAATKINTPTHKPTPIPNSTVSTQKSLVSSTAKTTTLACKTGASTAFSGPPSTTISSETTKETPMGVPETLRPTLEPEAGSGSRLSSCLLPMLPIVLGSSLLRALL